MIVNFAEPAHNHNWELDPVIRSLLDTDFHKVLMVQFIAGRPEQDSSPAAESSNGGNDLSGSTICRSGPDTAVGDVSSCCRGLRCGELAELS